MLVRAVDWSLWQLLKTRQLLLNLNKSQIPATKNMPIRMEGTFRDDTEKLKTPYCVLEYEASILDLTVYP